MNLKVLKYLFILIMVFVLFQILLIPNKAYATGVGDIVSQGDEFVSNGKILIDQDKLKSGQSLIFNILLAVGVILTVIVGGYLGIKFMIASSEDKAKIKEAMLPYVLGCVVIFGAFGIWKITVEVGGKISSVSQQEYNDERLDYTRRDNAKKIDSIEQGKKEVSELSDDEIKSLYRSNSIDSDLNEKVNGARNKNKKSLSQAISELSSAKKKIYQEAKSRNLLKKDAAGNEIWLK